MNHTLTHHIDELLAGIQKKWGRKALQPLAAVTSQTDFIPTGFSSLDTALGTGGIPKKRLTTLFGTPTCGMTTLAYSLMAQAQNNELIMVYLDAPHAFDPEYAAYRGVDMEMLLLVRPETWADALEMLRDVVAVPVGGLLVFDTSISDLCSSQKHKPLSAALQRVVAYLPQTTWTMVALVPVDLPVKVDSGASVRLRLERLDWLYTDDVLCGYRIQITVLKNKFASIDEPVTIDVALRG